MLARVVLNDGRRLEIPIPVIIECSQPYFLSTPEMVVFLTPQTAALVEGKKTRISRNLTIRAVPGQDPFRVKGVELVENADDLFDVDLWSIEPGKHYRVVVTLKAGSSQKQVQGKILVHTDSPLFPTIPVKIRAVLGLAPKKKVHR